MLRSMFFSLAVLLALGACSTERETSPPRTATEELLVSTAADRAAEHLDVAIPKGSKVFVDASNFEGTDSKYAIAAIRDHVARCGGYLVADRKDADMALEIRTGALSIDEKSLLVGIPRFDVPIPLAGNFKFPEIALFKRAQQKGVAKFAATGIDASTGQLIHAAEPDFGLSHRTDWVLLLFISWTTDDVMPKSKSGLTGRLLDDGIGG